MSEAIRLGTLVGGGALALYGFARGGWLGVGAVAAGTAVIARSRLFARRRWENRYYAARASVTILADVTDVGRRLTMDRWESLFSFIDRVEIGSADRHRLRLVTAGRRVTWDIVVTHEEPTWIQWRATPDSAVPGDGEIRLRQAPGDRGTELHVRILLGPPAAFVGAIAAGKVGHSGEPGLALIDDLRRLKQVIETREIATIDGQPRGTGRRYLEDRTRNSVPSRLLRSDWRALVEIGEEAR